MPILEREINFSELFDLILRRIWIIAVCVFITTTLSFSYSAFYKDKMYTSTGTLYVSNVQNKDDDVVDVGELNASTRLVSTYMEILRSNTFVGKISENIKVNNNLNYSIGQIKNMIAMSALNNTEILQIKITCKDPEHAAVILNTILDNADDEILRIIEGGSVKPIDYGRVPTSHSSPNITLNTITGAVVGLIISLLIIVAIHLMDVSVRGEEDMVDRYEIPVLGVIPTIKNEGK